MTEIIVKIFIAVSITLVTALLVTLPVMWLWNALMPDIFGVVEIGFWQALGVSILSSILFKGSGSNSSS